MKKPGKILTATIFSVSLLALIAFPVWLSQSRSPQAQLNADLIMALKLGQVEDARSLLQQGADPNARDLPDMKPQSIWQQLADLILRPRHPKNEQARTALSCATDNKRATLLVKMLTGVAIVPSTQRRRSEQAAKVNDQQ